MGFGNFLKKVGRANSSNLCGWVEGSLTHLKKSGQLQVILENGNLVCFTVGLDDVVIKKGDVESCDKASTDLPRQYANKIILCDSFIVKLKNGEQGNFIIFKGKVADFLMAIK